MNVDKNNYLPNFVYFCFVLLKLDRGPHFKV
jgi:hypothetical protein